MDMLKVKEYGALASFLIDTDQGNSYFAVSYLDLSRLGSGPLYWRMGTTFPPPIELTFGYDGVLYRAALFLGAAQVRVAPAPPPDFNLNPDKVPGVPKVLPSTWPEDPCVLDQQVELSMFWNGPDLWVVAANQTPASRLSLDSGGEVLFNARNEFVGMVAKGLSDAERQLANKLSSVP